MDKESIRQALFMGCHSEAEISYFTLKGRISKKQECLVFIFKQLPFCKDIEIFESYKSMEGKEEDLKKYFISFKSSVETLERAAAYICKTPGRDWKNQ